MAEQEDLPVCDYIPPLLFSQLAQQPPLQQQQQLQGPSEQDHELSSVTDVPVPAFSRPLPPQLLRQQPWRHFPMDPDIHNFAQSAITRSEEAEHQSPPRPHQQRQESPQPPLKRPQQSRRSLSWPGRLSQQNEEQHEEISPQDPPSQTEPVPGSQSRGSTSLKLKQAVQRVRARKERKQPIGLPQTPIQLENSWARMYVENAELKRQLKKKEFAIKKKETQVQNNERLLEKATYTMAHLHHENLQLHRETAETTPRLRGLEDALSDNISQVSLMQEEIEDESAGKIDLKQQCAAAKREAKDLRCLNNTLVNNLTEERKKVSRVEVHLDRLKLELDRVVEERLRFAVLEAENDALRNDLMVGMEHMMELAQIQQQMSIDLNNEDADIEDDLWREDDEKLDLQMKDPYNIPKEIRMRFRRDSIWDDLQAGPRREGEVYANAGIDMTDRGTEMTTPPPSSPFQGPSSLTVLATTAPSPPPLLITATTSFPPAEQGPPTTPPTPTKPPRLTSTHTHTNTYIHTHTQTQTQTHMHTTEKKAEIFLISPHPPLPPLLPLQPISNLPLLLFLLAAFFLALYADRLAVERETWRTANEMARETVVGWYTEWMGWEVAGWRWDGVGVGVGLGLLG